MMLNYRIWCNINYNLQNEIPKVILKNIYKKIPILKKEQINTIFPTNPLIQNLLLPLPFYSCLKKIKHLNKKISWVFVFMCIWVVVKHWNLYSNSILWKIFFSLKREMRQIFSNNFFSKNKRVSYILHSYSCI